MDVKAMDMQGIHVSTQIYLFPKYFSEWIFYELVLMWKENISFNSYQINS